MKLDDVEWIQEKVGYFTIKWDGFGWSRIKYYEFEWFRMKLGWSRIK